MRVKRLLWSVIVLLTAAYVSAEGFKDLGADEVKKIIDSRKGAVVVDARTGKEYREGHIPSAINIPPEHLAAISKHLPKDKKTPLIFYCRGIG